MAPGGRNFSFEFRRNLILFGVASSFRPRNRPAAAPGTAHAGLCPEAHSNRIPSVAQR